MDRKNEVAVCHLTANNTFVISRSVRAAIGFGDLQLPLNPMLDYHWWNVGHMHVLIAEFQPKN